MEGEIAEPQFAVHTPDPPGHAREITGVERRPDDYLAGAVVPAEKAGSAFGRELEDHIGLTAVRDGEKWFAHVPTIPSWFERQRFRRSCQGGIMAHHRAPT
jgi:hypothetical protein